MAGRLPGECTTAEHTGSTGQNGVLGGKAQQDWAPALTLRHPLGIEPIRDRCRLSPPIVSMPIKSLLSFAGLLPFLFAAPLTPAPVSRSADPQPGDTLLAIWAAKGTAIVVTVFSDGGTRTLTVEDDAIVTIGPDADSIGYRVRALPGYKDPFAALDLTELPTEGVLPYPSSSPVSLIGGAQLDWHLSPHGEALVAALRVFRTGGAPAAHLAVRRAEDQIRASLANSDAEIEIAFAYNEVFPDEDLPILYRMLSALPDSIRNLPI